MGLFDKIIKKEETKKELGTGKKRDIRHDIDVVPLEEDLIAKTIVEPEIRYIKKIVVTSYTCLLYTSPSPRDRTRSRMPSSA